MRNGDALRLAGMSGKIQSSQLLKEYFDANGDDAPLAPLLATLKCNVQPCYAHLDTEQDEVREALRRITVVEPTFSTEMPQEIKDRIARLEAFRPTTEEDKYPQLRDASQLKWQGRCAALYMGAADIAAKEMPPAVEDGFKLNSGHKSKKGPVKTYQGAARLSLDRVVEGLRDKYRPPKPEVLKKAKYAAFGDAFDLVVGVVEAQELKAIRAMPDKEPDLTRALEARFAPRAEAATERASEWGTKGATEKHRKAKEQGVDPLAAATKERKKVKFGRLQTPTGIERAPNNMYPAYVAERIKKGFLESKNIVRAWTNYKPRRKRANM